MIRMKLQKITKQPQLLDMFLYYFDIINYFWWTWTKFWSWYHAWKMFFFSNFSLQITTTTSCTIGKSMASNFTLTSNLTCSCWIVYFIEEVILFVICICLKTIWRYKTIKSRLKIRICFSNSIKNNWYSKDFATIFYLSSFFDYNSPCWSLSNRIQIFGGRWKSILDTVLVRMTTVGCYCEVV